MDDLISLLGYSKGSPYAHNPYLDIHTPEGLIDMSNTPFDLIGIDNLGNKKKMKAGAKNPYRFEGNVVREIPMKKGGKTKAQYAKERGLQDGGNTPKPKIDPAWALAHPIEAAAQGYVPVYTGPSLLNSQQVYTPVNQANIKPIYNDNVPIINRPVPVPIQKGALPYSSNRGQQPLTYVGPAHYQSDYEIAQNEQKKKDWAANQPNAVYNNGQLDRINQDYSMTGEPISPNAKRWQKGLSHMATGLEVAGYLTGAGEVYSAAKPFVKAGIQDLGAYLTEKTFLKNTYKMNPYAFKPNPEMLYRGIGETGYADAMNTGVLRPHARGTFGTDLYMSPDINLAKMYSRDFKSIPMGLNADGSIAAKNVVGNSYIAEVPSNLANKMGATNDVINEVVFNQPISNNAVNFYKQNWLRGYKKLPNPNVPEVLSRSSGMDAVFAKQPGYNSHLFNKPGYVLPTEDPKLMATISNPYESPLDIVSKTQEFQSMQAAENKDNWKAALNLNNRANRFVDNAILPDNLSQSKVPMYKNWDDIKKELDARDMFNINGGQSIRPKNWPLESQNVQDLLHQYNPSKYNTTSYNTLKNVEDAMHNDRVAASYFYPKAVGENKFISPVKYDPRLDQLSNTIKGINNIPQEQMIMNDNWVNHADWKEVASSYGDVMKGEGLNPAVEGDVDKFRKIMQESLNRTNQREMNRKLGNGYGMDLFKGIGLQQKGGNVYQEGGYSRKDILNFLLEEEPKQQASPDAPKEQTNSTQSEQAPDTPDSDYELAMQIANGMGDETPNMEFPVGNPYGIKSEGNPYTPIGKESPNAVATLQEFQPQGFTNLGIFPSRQHLLQNPTSDHNTGKALDLGVDNAIKGDAAVAKLQTEAQQKNIKYIIWNRKIWSPTTNTWKPYKGKDPHTTHIHISFNQ